MFSLIGMAIPPDRTHGVDVGEVFRDFLYEERRKLMALAAEWGYRDASHLCRAFNGQKGYAIDFWRVVELSVEDLEKLFSKILVRKRMARAELRSRADERKVS